MKVYLTGTLQRFADYRREHETAGGTIKDGLDQLLSSQPRLRDVLLDDQGRVREAHALFLNGEHLGRNNLDARVESTDSLEIITAIAGG